MLAAILFYAVLFLTLVVLPALLILCFLLFVDNERRLWKRVGPTVTPALKRFIERPSVRKVRERFPRIVSFVGRRLNPRDPWGLPATIATFVIVLGLWFFAGVIQDLVGKDPLVVLDIRLHNSVPLFRSDRALTRQQAARRDTDPRHRRHRPTLCDSQSNDWTRASHGRLDRG